MAATAEGASVAPLEKWAIAAFWTLAVLLIFEFPELPRRALRMMLLAKVGAAAVVAAHVGTGIMDRLGIPGKLFVASMVTHLAIGGALAWISLSSLEFGALRPDMKVYAVSIAAFVAVVAGARVVIGAWGFAKTFHGVLAVLTASMALNIVVPFWQYAGLPPIPGIFVHTTRFFGAFVSPMVSAFVGGATVVLGAALLARPRPGALPYVAMTLGFVGVVISFSKGGLFGVAVVLAFFLLRGGRRRVRLLAWIAIILASLAWIFAVVQFSTLLSVGQVARWSQVIDLLAGDWSGSATSSRNLIWEVGWRTYMQSPALGLGFGAMLEMDGAPIVGMRRLHRAGSHNQFLALGGEAGIVPVLLFALGMLALARPAAKAPRSYATDAVAGTAVLFFPYVVVEGHVFVLQAVVFIVGVACGVAAATAAGGTLGAGRAWGAGAAVAAPSADRGAAVRHRRAPDG